ncbi:nuclear transport factor 2 family protein [Roseomonas sp. CAU 1739]|uniref:nuclear transport factor 2 family protein n=1 Tax=Roseomonas sp. CAU 1739 TaxID=3140364 RepID=UPI00325BD29A
MLAGAAILAGVTLIAGEAAAQEQAAVAGAVEALTKAMLDVDRDKLLAVTAEQLSYGHSAGRIENRQQFVDNIMSRSSMFRRIELSEQTIGLAGNSAIVRHLFVGETVNPQGQVSPVRIGVLQVWQKPGSNWLLLARQAYRL